MKIYKYFSLKSIFFFLIIANLFLPLFVTNNAALAQSYDVKSATDQLCQGDTCPIQTPQKIFDILATVLKYTYTIFFIVAIIFILVAAFNFLTARGEPEKINSARSQILWAVVAIAIALISVGAAQIIRSFITS